MTHTTPLLLPCCTKDTEPNPENSLHPLGKLLRDKRFAQAALGMSIGLAISTAWFRYDSKVISPKLLSIIIAAVLTAAAMVVWNVNLLAKFFPAIAIAAERLGLAAMLFPFFAVVDAFVNKKSGGYTYILGWVPWGCLVGTVMIVSSVRVVARPQVITFKAFDWVR